MFKNIFPENSEKTSPIFQLSITYKMHKFMGYCTDCRNHLYL